MLFMKKKLMLALFCVAIFTILFSSTALAGYVESDGSNTTAATALEIQRNQVTPESRITIDLTKEHVAGGILVPNTEHWYKVTLPVNNETVLSVNADSFYVDVYDDSGTLLISKLVTKDYEESFRAYYVNVQTAGLYYIRLHSALSNNDYRVSIGNPHYNLSNTTIKASTLTLRPGVTAAQTTMNLANGGYPIDAIVYQVNIGGIRSARPLDEVRALKYANESTFKKANAANLLTYFSSLNKFLARSWTVKWEGTAKTVMTLEPAVKFYYVYPVLPNS